MPGRPGEPPTIHCAPLPAFAEADLDAVRAAFRQAEPVVLRQAWLDEPEPAFAPAVVRTAWRDDALLVFAELTDADVFTRATDHNQRFWELGDTFELFLQPVGDPAYVELHVAPSNLRVHARFAGAGAGARAANADPFADALRSPDAFRSRTWVRAEAGEWCVLADVPAAVVCGRPAPLDGATWRFSFSRYDHTRGRAAPVISSTSPHAAPGFHRRHEWGIIRFQR
jgi:hypothetical protein